MLQAVLAPSAELRPIAQNPAPASRQPVALGRRLDLQPPKVPSAAKTANRASRRPSSRPRRRTADLPRRCGRTTTTLLRRNLPKILSLPQRPQQLIGSRAVDNVDNAEEALPTLSTAPTNAMPTRDTYQPRQRRASYLRPHHPHPPSPATHRFFRGGPFLDMVQ